MLAVLIHKATDAQAATMVSCSMKIEPFIVSLEPPIFTSNLLSQVGNSDIRWNLRRVSTVLPIFLPGKGLKTQKPR